MGHFQYMAERDDEALAAYQSASDILKALVVAIPKYQPVLDQMNSNIDEVKKYIKDDPTFTPAAVPEEVR